MARAPKHTARPVAPTARTPAPPVKAERAERVETSAPDPVVETVLAPPPEPAHSETSQAAIVTAAAAEAAPPPLPPDRLTPDIAESFPTFVARGVGETRARFEAARIAGEQAFAAVEASCGAAQTGVSALHVRALEALQAGADAQFGLLKALTGAKTVSDVVGLHTEYARRQYEDATSRAKELVELAHKVAEESSAPLREHVAQVFSAAV